jgi:hypothetical protein
MNFFKKIQNSIYSPEFYSDIPKQSFGSALKYFFLLILLVSVLSSIMPIYLFVTVGQQEVEKFVNQAGNAYPSELNIKIQNGKLTTNTKEPYLIPFLDDKTQTDGMQNLVVIDTKTPFTITQFNKYQTLAWVTADSVMLKDKNQGQLRAIDLTSIKNFNLNKQVINSYIAKASPLLRLLLPVIIIAIVVGLFVANIFLLVYLLFVAILIWLLLKLIKKPLSYGDSYKVGMYAITLELLIGIVSAFLHQPGFPFMGIIITLLVVWFNFHSTQKVVKPAKVKKTTKS